MLRGLGTDIIEIDRIQLALERTPKFKEKVFTTREIEIVERKKNPYPSYAGRFAAKEAVSKAFGTGVRGFSIKEIEIINDDLGKPVVVLGEGLKEKYGDFRIELSVSHSRDYATATAILLEEVKF